MTTNRMARQTDKHFCPRHGITDLLAVADWFTLNGAPVVVDGDRAECGAQVIASSNFITVNGRAVVRRGDTSDHGGLVIDGAQASEFVHVTDTTGLLLPIGTSRPPANVIAFVGTYYCDTYDLAEGLGIHSALMLAVSGIESAWGTSKIARTLNNFYGQHSPHPLENSYRLAEENSKVKISIFADYRTSARSFAQRSGPVIRNMHDPLEAAQKLQKERGYAIDTISQKPDSAYPGKIKTANNWCQESIIYLKNRGELPCSSSA